MEHDLKLCPKCKKLKDITDFGLDRRRKGGLKPYCKECRKKEPQNEERKKKWYQANKERCNDNMRKWTKENKHAKCWRGLLRSCLKRMGQNKTSKTNQMLGYSSDEFKSHIESLWQDGMSWDNYGEWQIDHIIPIHCFPAKTHPSIVNSLGNIRPMWKEDNYSRPKKNIMPADKRPYTMILDIDGCLVEHTGTLSGQIENKLDILPGVKDRFNEWNAKGYKIVLITGRTESMRETTETLLRNHGLFWDHLIMGIGGGQRVLINDLKPHSPLPTAIAVNLDRNKGMTCLDIDEAIRIQTLAAFYGASI